jgi:hypothetical protein
MSKSSAEERIERYLRNALTEQERDRFQRDLKTDEDLRASLTMMEKIREALGWSHFLGQLDEELARQRFFAGIAKEKRLWTIRRTWMAAAASVALLLIAGWSYLVTPDPTDWDALALVSIQQIDLEVAGRRSLNATDTTTFYRAANALARQDYAAASELLRAIPATSPKYARAQVLRAFSALAQQDYPKVLEITEVILTESEPSLELQKAEWLRVKASVGLQSPDRLLLDKIAQDPDHRFTNSARQLLAELP